MCKYDPALEFKVKPTGFSLPGQAFVFSVSKPVTLREKIPLLLRYLVSETSGRQAPTLPVGLPPTHPAVNSDRAATTLCRFNVCLSGPSRQKQTLVLCTVNFPLPSWGTNVAGRRRTLWLIWAQLRTRVNNLLYLWALTSADLDKTLVEISQAWPGI